MEHEFDKIPIPKLVLKLGLPAMCAQFFNILYSIVDRAFVGHIAGHGEIALASIGICAPVLTAITAFSSLIGIGGASVMSISIGKKDYKNAKLAINQAFFIYVLHMDIQGAACASVLAQFCVLFYVFRFLFSEKTYLPLERTKHLTFHFNVIRKILTIGSLPFFIMLFDNLLIISLNFVLRKYGGEVMGDQYISCAAVVQSFMILVFYPAQGITSGCGTLYSYHYGAGHYDKIVQIFRYVFFLCASYMLILCITVQFVPEMFVQIFVKEKRLMILSVSCIRKYTLGLLGVAVQYAIIDGLTTMGQIRSALPISFFRKILYMICVFLIPLTGSRENIFYSETISDLIGASVTIIVFIAKILPELRDKPKP